MPGAAAGASSGRCSARRPPRSPTAGAPPSPRCARSPSSSSSTAAARARSSSTRADPSVTEIAAGSGLFGPHLFDHYARFRPAPAASFALAVVRRPASDIATVLGGGWIASGPHGADRAPLPVWPAGLRMLPREGAGEVQTPLRGPAARDLAVGDRVWFRHTKAGELSEHLDEFLLVDDDRVTGALPTYRGEGRTFL